MPRARFTAKAALITLLVWLALALGLHLRSELWPSSTPDASTPLEKTPGEDAPVDNNNGPHFSEGGSEPDLPAKPKPSNGTEEVKTKESGTPAAIASGVTEQADGQPTPIATTNPER